MEKELSIKELLAQCMKVWVPIVLCTVLCAGAGAVYGMQKGSGDPLENTVEESASSLTQAQKGLVESTFAQYVYNIEQSEVYAKAADSLLLKTNPYQVSVLRLVYVVTSDLGNGSALYQTLDFNEAEETQLRTLLKISEECVDSYVVTESENGSVSVLTVNVYCALQEHSKEIQEIVDGYLMRKTADYNAQGISVRVENQSVSSTTGYNAYVYGLQEDYITTYGQVLERLTDLETPEILKGDELSYYSALVAAYYGNTVMEAQSNGTRSLVKYGLVGGFGGFLLALALVMIRYMSSQALHTETDVKSAGAGPLLAYVVDEESKNTIRTKLVTTSPLTIHQLSNLSMKIKEDCKSLSVENLFVYAEEQNKDIAQELVNHCDSLHITYGNPIEDVQAYGSLCHAEGVLFVIDGEQGQQNDVIATVEAAKKNHKHVLGSILVKK